MKTKRTILVVLALSMLFGFYGVGFSGGGPEDPACDFLPPADSGKFLRGEFTVARDEGDCTVEDPEKCGHYNVHAYLRWGYQEHLFSFQSALGSGDLCSYTEEQLMEEFARRPCTEQVGVAFGLYGVPVITDLQIVARDSCWGLDEMIRGEIVIRVVPLP